MKRIDAARYIAVAGRGKFVNPNVVSFVVWFLSGCHKLSAVNDTRPEISGQLSAHLVVFLPTILDFLCLTIPTAAPPQHGKIHADERTARPVECKVTNLDSLPGTVPFFDVSQSEPGAQYLGFEEDNLPNLHFDASLSLTRTSVWSATPRKSAEAGMLQYQNGSLNQPHLSLVLMRHPDHGGPLHVLD